MYDMCWIYTCASVYDAFTRSVHSPAALIPGEAVPGRDARSWLVGFRKTRFSSRRRGPPCPVRPAAVRGAAVGEDRTRVQVCPR